MVELFNEKYYKSIQQSKIVEIESIFGKTQYENDIKQFNSLPMILKNIKVIADNNSDNKNALSNCKVNDHEFKFVDYYTLNQFQSNIIDIELNNETYIHNMSIEVKPNTEILVSFK